MYNHLYAQIIHHYLLNEGKVSVHVKFTANRTKEGVEGQDAEWEKFGGQKVFQLSLICLNVEANFLCG